MPEWRTNLYYRVKPLIPRGLRYALRRAFAEHKRKLVRSTWPILPGSEVPPEGWSGWPKGKQFAFVLTHDIEGRNGFAQVQCLAELEMAYGFRSAFNFVPEGEYKPSQKLFDWLTTHGFEVGIHDLHHDGSLYRNRAGFKAKAERINGYLKRWGATGFRSAFMLHKLDWLHDLDIEYDCSTFDTDPFEPQPDGQETIFPFWVPNQNGYSLINGRQPGRQPRKGYIELPYTLPQDSTLYLLFRENTAAIWRTKLDWVAAQGGMALLNVHPDYLDFGETFDASLTYSPALYKDFLRYVSERYEHTFWHALPRDIAAYARDNLCGGMQVAGINGKNANRRPPTS